MKSTFSRFVNKKREPSFPLSLNSPQIYVNIRAKQLVLSLNLYICQIEMSILSQKDDYFEKIQDATGFIKKRIAGAHEVGVVLGTGLGSFSELIEDPTIIPYSEIPHFPQSTVEGHDGNLTLDDVLGPLGRRVLGIISFYCSLHG